MYYYKSGWGYNVVSLMQETQGGQRLEGDKTTSPFSFSSERGGANRHAGRVQELNQLSSWPNFKL